MPIIGLEHLMHLVHYPPVSPGHFGSGIQDQGGGGGLRQSWKIPTFFFFEPFPVDYFYDKR